MTKESISAVEFDALPVYSIGGTAHVVTDHKTGESRIEREPQRFLIHHDTSYVRAHGDLWIVFTDQDGKTWRERL